MGGVEDARGLYLEPFEGKLDLAEDEDAVPPEARPDPSDLDFDLEAIASSVVSVRSEVPREAYTASILGTERQGNGVVINDKGLVLTIGYLISEAETIWLTGAGGKVAPGHALAYDFVTGLGLVQPLGSFAVPPVRLGSTSHLEAGDELVVQGSGGLQSSLSVHLAGKREFAGYWEYFLEQALFTVPAHPHWGGAALLDGDGRLIGIGSLLIQADLGDKRSASGNMFVPAELLVPVLDDLLTRGRRSQPPRPWLGVYASDGSDGVVVHGLAAGGPAEQAGIREGDILAGVGDAAVEDLAELWQRIWALGEAGTEVPLVVMRDGGEMVTKVRSIDRASFMRGPSLH